MTVHYRWHPLFGQSLRVHRRVKTRNGEQIFCQLPDNTLCALPMWMFSAECAQFTVGPPLIRIEALRELRDVLTAWQTTSFCDKASLTQSPPEVVHETVREADQPSTDAFTNPYCIQSGSNRREAERIGSGAGGAADQRRTRRRRRKKDKRGRR